MTPVEKALWFIESNFAGEISLDEIARHGGVSRYQMARAFSAATGHTVMRYVRGRRLSEAARSLAQGAPDILAVALDAGYGSHEAFTRAFHDQFGVTPDAVRGQRLVDTIALMEPIKMDETPITDLQPPRIETGRSMLIAGLGERYTSDSSKAIPAQWQRFLPYLGNIPGQVGQVSYGVCCNNDDDGNFDHIAGVEVSDFSDLPAELSRTRIPKQRYAVFVHSGHISTIRRTVNSIWNVWLPNSEYRAADTPDFERYDKEFDPETGNGAVEIWVPVKN